jgi:hypothetical protein
MAAGGTSVPVNSTAATDTDADPYLDDEQTFIYGTGNDATSTSSQTPSSTATASMAVGGGSSNAASGTTGAGSGAGAGAATTTGGSPNYTTYLIYAAIALLAYHFLVKHKST